MSLKAQAQTGFAAASHYDAHRPTYPPKSVDNLLEQLRLKGKAGAKVIDLAAGTGKFTELLAKREEKFEIIAVEPQSDMRAVLEKKALPGVKVVDGLATSIPVDDESVDAVIAAQSFHWFAEMPALKEIHRVLHMHGTFGMIWNIEDYNAPPSHEATTPWEDTWQKFVATLDDDSPRFRHEKWRKVFDDQLSHSPLQLLTSTTPLFSLPIGDFVEDFEVWVPNKDAVWARLETLSQISVMKGQEREDAEKIFRDAIDQPSTQVNEEGEVAIHGATYSSWTTKIPA